MKKKHRQRIDIVFVFIFCIAFCSIEAQGWKGYEWDVFPVDRRWRQGGFTWGIGLNYPMPYPGQQNRQNISDSSGRVFIYQYKVKGLGKPALNAEVGWFHSFKRPFYFHYFDVLLTWRWWRGAETVVSEMQNSSTGQVLVTEEKGKFSDHTIGLSINLINQYAVSADAFFIHGPGINVDYFLITTRQATFPLLQADYYSPPVGLGQIHYKIGWGWVIKNRWLIIPTLETPVFQIMPFRHIYATLNYYHSRYRPFLLHIRILLLRKKRNDCPPVINPAGIHPDTYQPSEKD